MGQPTQNSPDVGASLARVDQLFGSRPAKQRHGRALSRGTVLDLQVAALHHPDPHIRRSCLWMLDHHANDASMPVFARAIEDDVDFVREIALHSLACEGCKKDALCVADVVPSLIRVLEADPKPDLRIKALSALLGLSPRDGRAREALSELPTTTPTPWCAGAQRTPSSRVSTSSPGSGPNAVSGTMPPSATAPCPATRPRRAPGSRHPGPRGRPRPLSESAAVRT